MNADQVANWRRLVVARSRRFCARSPDRATGLDRRSPPPADSGRPSVDQRWHGRELPRHNRGCHNRLLRCHNLLRRRRCHERPQPPARAAEHANRGSTLQRMIVPEPPATFAFSTRPARHRRHRRRAGRARRRRPPGRAPAGWPPACPGRSPGCSRRPRCSRCCRW